MVRCRAAVLGLCGKAEWSCHPSDVELHGSILRRSVTRAAPPDILNQLWCFGSPVGCNIIKPRLLDLVCISVYEKASLFEACFIGEFFIDQHATAQPRRGLRH